MAFFALLIGLLKSAIAFVVAIWPVIKFVGVAIGAGASAVFAIVTSVTGNSNWTTFFKQKYGPDDSEQQLLERQFRAIFGARSPRTLRVLSAISTVISLLLALYLTIQTIQDITTNKPWRQLPFWPKEAEARQIPATDPPRALPIPLAPLDIRQESFEPKVTATDTQGGTVQLAIRLEPTPQAATEIGEHAEVRYSFGDGSPRSISSGALSSDLPTYQPEIIAAKTVTLKVAKDGRQAGPFTYRIEPVTALLGALKDRLNADVNWVSCSNGVCFPRALAMNLPAVRQIRIGRSRERLPIALDVPRFTEQALSNAFAYRDALTTMYVVPNADSFIQLIFFDGSSSAVQAFHDQSNDRNLRGDILSATGQPDAPLLLSAFDANRGTWSFLPLARPGETAQGYSVDAGGFFPITPSGQLWNGHGFELNSGLPNGYVRIDYVRSDGSPPGEFTYDVPREITTRADTANLLRDAPRLVECKRFMPQDFVHEGKKSFSDLMSQNSINMGRTASGYGWVHQPGVACILPQLGGKAVVPDVRAISGIDARGEPGASSVDAPVQDIPDNPNLQKGDYIRNFSHFLLPPETTQVYVRYVLKDGSKTGEYRIAIPEWKP